MKKIALSLFVIASSGAYVWSQAGKAPVNDMIGTAVPAGATGVSAPLSLVSSVPADPGSTQADALPEIRQQDVRRVSGPNTPIDTAAIAVAAPKPALDVNPPQAFQMPAAGPEQQLVPAPTSPSLRETPSFALTPAVYVPIPQPRPTYQQAPARVIYTGMKLAAHGYSDGVYTGPAADAYYGIIQLQALVQGGSLTALKVLKYPNDRRTSVNINRQALPMLRDEAIRAQSANVDIISGATLTSRAFIQSLGGALKKASL